MTALGLARKYMNILFSGMDVEELRTILSDDCVFSGPFVNFGSAEEYIASLEVDPPAAFQYDIIRAYEDEESACLIYQFSKPGVTTPMAQFFEVKNDKISRILLVFDTGAFK